MGIDIKEELQLKTVLSKLKTKFLECFKDEEFRKQFDDEVAEVLKNSGLGLLSHKNSTFYDKEEGFCTRPYVQHTSFLITIMNDSLDICDITLAVYQSIMHFLVMYLFTDVIYELTDDEISYIYKLGFGAAFLIESIFTIKISREYSSDIVVVKIVHFEDLTEEENIECETTFSPKVP